MNTLTQNDFLSAPHVYCWTKKNFDNCIFTWTVENVSFFLLGEDPGYCIKSPQFPLDEPGKSHIKWQVQMYPCGFRPDYKDLLSVHLCLKSNPGYRLKIKCKLSCRGSSDSICELINFEGVLTQENEKLHANVNRKCLLENMMKDDIFKLKIEIIAAVHDRNELMKSIKPVSHRLPKLKLREDLLQMLVQKQFCDVVVIAKGTEFEAHQNILCTRSPVFAAMLRHATLENQLKRIDIIDIEPEIMQNLLEFIYTGTIKYTNIDMALEVLIAADKYAIDDLKNLSEEYLILNTNTSNCLTILNVADLHSAEELKSKTINFIRSNKNSFTNLAQYESIESSQLLTEISANMAM